MKSQASAYLVLSFAQLGREGMGPRRGRADLVDVSQLDLMGTTVTQLFDGTTLQQGAQAMELSLQPAATRAKQVSVSFMTPTELKTGHQVSAKPEFWVLAARIRDRLSTLRSLYDDGPLDIDFRAFGARAERVRLTHCDIRPVEGVRRSSRTGQVHSIGGFIGEAGYEGDLTEFVPFLYAAKWTGVGRQTVWGKGRIDVNVREESESLGNR